ncbi:aminoethylphosphonate catabolism LysR family transcriptional regulator [Pseudorhodoferax soli]|uniref:Aminoethylphosphonate catabolism LysR family transcriptional regulator n=2 Tax=Pseudorhodoferax soli TaxID=545864 RepID=A0A368YB86_9BURK|nr:aminoethylphosphonate catabolism LysR family transcriptional regulator [Pseudorhodoferax soli]
MNPSSSHRKNLWMSAIQIRAFMAVAQHRSFSAAARALGLSQPTLTAQVQQLERRHAVQLFLRRGHGVELTDVGQRLLPLARQLGALEVEAYNLLHDNGQLNAGHLKLGAVGPFHVIEMVDAYRKRYPRIELSIRLGNSTSVFRDLQDYTIDLGVLARFHEPPGFTAIPYARHAIVLSVQAGHPFAERREIRIEELENMPLLQRESGSSTRRAIEAALRQAGVKPKVAMEIGSREALREASIRGMGIGTVSEAEFIPDERLRLVRIEGDPAFTETCLYCLDERRGSPLLMSFIDVAKGLRA